MVPANDGQSDFSVGPLKVDLLSRRVSIRGQEIHLTPIEYRLLSVLVKHAGKTLTHRQLMHDVWGSARSDQGHYLRIYMRQLATSSKRSRPGRAFCSRRWASVIDWQRNRPEKPALRRSSVNSA